MATGQVTTVEQALASTNGSAVTLACPALEQRVVHVAPRERRELETEGRSAILFVTGGRGLLRTGGEQHVLESEAGAYVGDRDAAELEATGDEPLELVAVLAPPGEPTSLRVVRYDEEAARDAGIGREFRLLVACSEATQFLGIVPPGRAKFHNHPYDELAYVVEGAGLLHWKDGPSVPVGAGSCIHFPRLVFHSLENTGDANLRIMGVFHPAGSPADRVEVLDH